MMGRDHVKIARDLLESADSMYEHYEDPGELTHYDRYVACATAHALVAIADALGQSRASHPTQDYSG